MGLGSRRSADNDLRDLECAILHNLNHLAGTAQTTLPVTKTLDHFIGHVGSRAFAHLLRRHTQRLLRMKALDDFRFQADAIIGVDGTSYLSFSHCHCPQCLTQKHSSGTLSYLHPVLEAKLLRWVEQLPYTDSLKRAWTLGAILCEEISPTGEKTTFAWLTNLAVGRDSVIAIADQVGRLRTKIENEGFNVQKNSGLNLEHVFSQNWDHAKAYYYLLQSSTCKTPRGATSA